ncbi:fibroblast growth factor 16-like [Centruroides sculpturatus]|uniref:fibroblast growth factor 16-like n=1 Tax=Centruroides sculpturatus TaxID=218467 RepID=UPI000C6EBE55|nr:fibroblast growth factor 16-like [Centruroides sculpturatus]
MHILATLVLFCVTACAQERNARYGQLYCQTGYHLQILDNGKINGTREIRSKHAMLEMMKLSMNILAIRGIVSERYLCMSRKGKLYGSKVMGMECYFQEKMLSSYYNVYSSYKYTRKKRKWLIGLTKKGRAKRGKKAKQNITHFSFRFIEPSKDIILYNVPKKNWPNIDKNIIRRQRASRRRHKNRKRHRKSKKREEN